MKLIPLACALSLACVACSKPADTGTPPNAAPAAAAPGLRDAKTLLADPKAVAGYATYQTEMAPFSKTAMEIFAAAAKSGGGMKGMEEAAKKDPRIAEYNQRNEAALAKVGLTQADVGTFTSAITSLVVSLGMVRGTDPSKAMAEIVKSQQESLAKAKQEFLAQYGQAALDNVLKFEKELCDAQDAMMKAVLSK